jgi:succinate dehydrogenase / fumarate reductase membrane anchor subunit
MLKSNNMKTPLAQARGLGAAKSGLSHWWHQRLTAIAMVGLVAWMCALVVMLAGADFESAMSLLSHPLNAAILILFVGVGFWHSALGLQVVLEDYVAHEGIRLTMIIALRMVLILLGAISMLSLLKIAL